RGQGICWPRAGGPWPSLFRRGQATGRATKRLASPHKEALQGIGRAAVHPSGIRSQTEREADPQHARASGGKIAEGRELMLAWMLYVIVVSSLLSLAALALERSAQIRRRPTRWPWGASMMGSLLVPLAMSSVSLQIPRLAGVV